MSSHEEDAARAAEDGMAWTTPWKPIDEGETRRSRTLLCRFGRARKKRGRISFSSCPHLESDRSRIGEGRMPAHTSATPHED